MKTLNYAFTFIALFIISTCFAQGTKIDIRINASKVAIFQAYDVHNDDICTWEQTDEPVYVQTKQGKFKTFTDTTSYLIFETFGFQKENGENYRYLVKFDGEFAEKFKAINLEVYDGYVIWIIDNIRIEQKSFSEKSIEIFIIEI